MGHTSYIMSDEEYYEEDEATSQTSKKGSILKGRGKAGKGELDEQLREYINEWRSQRAKEEEELKRLRKNKPNAKKSAPNKKRNWLHKRKRKRKNSAKRKLKRRPKRLRKRGNVWRKKRKKKRKRRKKKKSKCCSQILQPSESDANYD